MTKSYELQRTGSNAREPCPLHEQYLGKLPVVSHPIAESRITRSSASDARDDGVTRHAKVMLKRYPGPNAHTVAEVNRSHVRGAHIAPVHLADESFKEYMESEEARELLKLHCASSKRDAATRKFKLLIKNIMESYKNDGRKRPRH